MKGQSCRCFWIDVWNNNIQVLQLKDGKSGLHIVLDTAEIDSISYISGHISYISGRVSTCTSQSSKVKRLGFKPHEI